MNAWNMLPSWNGAQLNSGPGGQQSGVQPRDQGDCCMPVEDNLPLSNSQLHSCAHAWSKSNSKYAFWQGQGWSNSDSSIKWTECTFIIMRKGCSVQVFSFTLDGSVGSVCESFVSRHSVYWKLGSKLNSKYDEAILVFVMCQAKLGCWYLMEASMLQLINSLAPRRCGCYLISVICKLILLISWVHLVKLFSGECYKTPFMISQHYLNQYRPRPVVI